VPCCSTSADPQHIAPICQVGFTCSTARFWRQSRCSAEQMKGRRSDRFWKAAPMSFTHALHGQGTCQGSAGKFQSRTGCLRGSDNGGCPHRRPSGPVSDLNNTWDRHRQRGLHCLLHQHRPGLGQHKVSSGVRWLILHVVVSRHRPWQRGAVACMQDARDQVFAVLSTYWCDGNNVVLWKEDML